MRAATLLLCALSPALAAQIPPGSFVGAVEPGAAPPGFPLIALEPLRGTTRPVSDPGSHLPAGVTAVLAVDDGRALVVGAPAPGGSARLLSAALAGTSIASVQPLTGNLAEPIVGLAHSPDGRVAVLTPTRLLAVSGRGGMPSLLASATPGTRFVAVTTYAASVVALETGGPASASHLHFVVPATGASAIHAVAIQSASAIAFEPLLRGFVIADSTGALHLVEPARLIVSRLGTVGAPVLAIGNNTDQRELLVATRGGAWTLAAGSPRGPVPAPPLSSIDYVSYASSFHTYGRACSAAALHPAIGATGTPHPGSVDFVVRLSGATPGARAFLLLGLTPTALPLDRIGMPTCTLLVDPIDARPVPTTALGTAAARIPLPADPGIVGFPLHLQWAVPAPGANAIGLLLSGAGRATP